MLRFAANISFLFAEHPFLDRHAAAAAAGFAGVENAFPVGAAKEEIAERLAANGLVQVLMNMPAGDEAAGERGLACLPDRIAAFEDGVGRAIDYAVALGCRRLHCLAGLAPPGASRSRLRDTYLRNLDFAARACAAHGITVNVEPINNRDMPGYFITRTDEALAAIDEVGAANLTLQLDLYHRQVMEGDLIPALERLMGRIGHIQIADTPGRHEPGTGEINYAVVLRRLDSLGYDGWVGCEYVPAAGTLEGLGWIEPYRRPAAGG